MDWTALKPMLDYGVAVAFASILLVAFLRYQGRLVKVTETQAQTLTKVTFLVEALAVDVKEHRRFENPCRYPGGDLGPLQADQPAPPEMKKAAAG